MLDETTAHAEHILSVVQGTRTESSLEASIAVPGSAASTITALTPFILIRPRYSNKFVCANTSNAWMTFWNRPD